MSYLSAVTGGRVLHHHELAGTEWSGDMPVWTPSDGNFRCLRPSPMREIWRDGKLAFSVKKRLPPETVDRSSLCREAAASATTVLDAPAGLLAGAAVTLVGDNRGLSHRHAKGCTDQVANTYLLKMAKCLEEQGAWVENFTWLPRESDDIRRVDAGSKEVQEELRTVKGREIRRLFSEKGWPRPNLDAFADAQTRRFPRYFTTDRADAEGRYNAFVQGLGATDIPWCFPPLFLLQRALALWYNSGCQLAYFVVPEIREARFWGILRALDFTSLGRVEVRNAKAGERFRVVVLLK